MSALKWLKSLLITELLRHHTLWTKLVKLVKNTKKFVLVFEKKVDNRFKKLQTLLYKFLLQKTMLLLYKILQKKSKIFNTSQTTFVESQLFWLPHFKLISVLCCIKIKITQVSHETIMSSFLFNFFCAFIILFYAQRKL